VSFAFNQTATGNDGVKRWKQLGGFARSASIAVR